MMEFSFFCNKISNSRIFVFGNFVIKDFKDKNKSNCDVRKRKKKEVRNDYNFMNHD